MRWHRPQREELHDGWDSEYECLILDEDKLLDEMEDRVAGGGVVVDYHSCDFFPERWFDLVVVLRARTEVLHERLTKREYSQKKLNDNMQCEIMDVLLTEAKESYKEEIVQDLPSNSIEEMEANVQTLAKWAADWSQ